MHRQDSTWNRQELYEKVWQFPLRTLAAEYGISDVGLAKVCRKLEIPLPGLGHWTKIACGQCIARPSLPAMERVPVLIRQMRKSETPILPDDAPKLERIESLSAAKTPPVTKAMLAHPLIEKTRLLLNEAASRDGEKLWATREAEWLDLRVTKRCLARALGIMAGIIHMLEREGFKLVVEKKNSESTSAIVYGETIRFGLIERFRQVKLTSKPDLPRVTPTTPSASNPRENCRWRSGAMPEGCRRPGGIARVVIWRTNCPSVSPE